MLEYRNLFLKKEINDMMSFLFKQKQSKAKQNKKSDPVRELDFLLAFRCHSSHLRYLAE